jgi:hypothetical protein
VGTLSDRLERHVRQQERLAALADDELAALGALGTVPGAWGVSGTIVLDGQPLFVKRLPLTEVEVANPGSTANHFALPTFYQYGVGSAGFGAHRELHAHQRATQLVADGRCASFPLLHHHRVLPRVGPSPREPRDRDAYVASWNGDVRVGRYIDARRDATHELWLVCEHLPHRLDTWLTANQERVEWVLGELLQAVRTLRDDGMVHFDAHFANVVCDGDGVYLADFGLALAAGFELDEPERRFLAQHQHYDLGMVIFNLVWVVRHVLERLSDAERREVLRIADLGDAAAGSSEVLWGVVRRARAVADAGAMELAPEMVAALERYWPVMTIVGELLRRLANDPGKRARHDDAALAAVLAECGIVD